MSKNRNNDRGKVVKHYLGYNIRKMVEKTEIDKWQRGVGTLIKDKGLLGLYAGKKLIKGDFKQIEDAITYVEENLHKK